LRGFCQDSKVDVNYWCKENTEQNLDALKSGKGTNRMPGARLKISRIYTINMVNRELRKREKSKQYKNKPFSSSVWEDFWHGSVTGD